MAKAELLADERDRAARQAAESALQTAELDSRLAAERARVAELRVQLERKAPKSASTGREADPALRTPRQRRTARGKPGE